MEQLLSSLGINIASNIIYDLIKLYFAQTSNPTVQGLKEFISPKLIIVDADIKASTIISFLAQNGNIIIQGSDIFAAQSVIMASDRNAKLVFGSGSTSATEKTKIETGLSAQIVTQGGAQVKQNEDGSISFHV